MYSILVLYIAVSYGSILVSKLQRLQSYYLEGVLTWEGGGYFKVDFFLGWGGVLFKR